MVNYWLASHSSETRFKMLLPRAPKECMHSFVYYLAVPADGFRFLWVAFEIEDICAQQSDEDIRKVIRDLPKDLPEIYERILARIDRAGTAEIAQKIFKWVASVRRPLSPEELRE